MVNRSEDKIKKAACKLDPKKVDVIYSFAMRINSFFSGLLKTIKAMCFLGAMASLGFIFAVAIEPGIVHPWMLVSGMWVLGVLAYCLFKMMNKW